MKQMQIIFKIQFIPRRKRSVCHDELMLFTEITDVYSENTKHVNTLCGQNVEFLNVKNDGIYSYLYDFSG
jgi:hypothetical protein